MIGIPQIVHIYVISIFDMFMCVHLQYRLPNSVPNNRFNNLHDLYVFMGKQLCMNGS